MARDDKMGFNATWSMAVGGMIGGGIFTVLGVIISLAGGWAWVSFALGGIIALCTGWSYSELSVKYEEAGGAFEFLRRAQHAEFAAGLSWVLVIGYALTISVYGFTFGHYFEVVVGGPSWTPQVAALGIILFLIAINLAGVADASWLEIITVWGKLAVLLGLAAFGLAHWAPQNVAYSAASPGGLLGGLVGAATVFMAYEGFQLLTYDYCDIRNANRVLPLATLSAIGAVMFVYIIVTLGASSLAGADTLVRQKEIALAAAGRAAFGTPGAILVSVAATFSAASAINATIFATARLGARVAAVGDMPQFMLHENKNSVPDRAIVLIGAAGGLLAVTGGLTTLVESASLAFLFTFVTVNLLAYRERVRHRWVTMVGALLGSAAIVGLVIRLAATDPAALAAATLLALLVLGARIVVVGRRKKRASG